MGAKSKGQTRQVKGTWAGKGEKWFWSAGDLSHFPATQGMERRRQDDPVEMEKELGAAGGRGLWGESVPLVSPKKAGQCTSAPCPGQIRSRSAPTVDNREGNGGVGVRAGTQGSSQK